MKKILFFLLVLYFSNNYFSLASCGNGKIEKNEECDIGINDTCKKPSHCTCNCMCIESCGNGFKGSNEECDDGNNLNGDGCTRDCTVEHVYCHEKCVGLSKWYSTGHIVNSKTCVEDEIAEWNLTPEKICCCKLLGGDPLNCRKFEKGEIKWETLEKNAREVLNNCPLAILKKENKFSFNFVEKISNNQCSFTDCSNLKVTFGICNPEGCTVNLCAQAIHEEEHLKRCSDTIHEEKANNNLNEKGCSYIEEEIIAQEIAYNACIKNAGPNCNCEYEWIYLKKECNEFKEKNCFNEIKNEQLIEICKNRL